MKVLLIGKLKTGENSLWRFVKDKQNKIGENFNAIINDNKASIPFNNDSLLILIPENNDPVVENTIKQTLPPATSELYVCSHRLPNPESNAKMFRIDFVHVENKEPYKQIAELIHKLPNDAAEAKKKFDDLCNYIKKNSSERIKAQILHLFLPLDIDMQALEILFKDEEKRRANKHIEYLKEMLADEKNNPAFYQSKLSEAIKLLNQILDQMPEGNNRTKLEALFGKNYHRKGIAGFSCIERFLQILDAERYLTVNNNYSNEDVKEVVMYFKNCCIDEFWKDINSFHDWYCALAECLTDEGACK